MTSSKFASALMSRSTSSSRTRSPPPHSLPSSNESVRDMYMSDKYKMIADIILSHANESNMLHRMACGVIQGKKVMALGHNSYRTYIQKTTYPSFHAEYSATHKLMQTATTPFRKNWLSSVTLPERKQSWVPQGWQEPYTLGFEAQVQERV